ncbi:PucR family transcriptional regulator ligand-binding domain-containing protein [Staphylococcus simiae]|uniref:PucR family transcriptional regulator n=1 Tax=Staphylococcus simiae TaxID=308354 RepID=UPI001A975DE7|nr:PucR family transcriptional regulator [Staphylococcus simiae]MBO1198748.1 PucR family transcriptional regulator ligand-binding domain-containing protein [Staphylococcus simiae]MBO1201000.1 PucR family transcriptional regulator ligand-binding domain-containing protein [Staphylococcus simiae]MBO1203155.1 PucR family transcriptional regulator ligand-binding domain-containing protein [Staphylococcus simiae]MBO1210737.1 PucR family transcriptional regulator ligand-binding domain-containing protei
MASLRDMLSMPQFNAFSLINHHGNLDTIIEGLDITENSDIKHFTKPNTFILTTGLLYQDDQQGLIQLIRDLKDVGVAGLGIKVSRFLHAIDQVVIDIADDLAFPLIEIPENWNLGDASHQMSAVIENAKTEKLNYALYIQQELNQLLIKGFDVDTMIQFLSKRLGVPILLFDPFKRPISMSQHYQHQRSLINDHIKYFKQHISEIEQDDRRSVFVKENHIIYKVRSYNYFPYYLMVTQSDKLTYPFSLLTIEQVVSVLSFSIYKSAKIEEAEQNEINRFFESLVLNDSDTALSVKQHPQLLERYNIYNSKYYQVVTCSIDETQKLENSNYLYERQYLTFQWLLHKFSDLDSKISIYKIPSNDQFVILLQNRHHYFWDYLKLIQQEFHNFFEGSLSFGVGNEVTEFSQLPYSYFEASEALNNIRAKGQFEQIESYRSKDISELLQLIPSNKLIPFIKYTLGDLAKPKTKKEAELKQTLRIYMDNHCDITKTAEQIFIHRNTVKYRINKCAQILDTTIEDPDISLNLRLALYASELVDLNH